MVALVGSAYAHLDTEGIAFTEGVPGHLSCSAVFPDGMRNIDYTVTLTFNGKTVFEKEWVSILYIFGLFRFLICFART